MPSLIVTDSTGVERTIEAQTGLSIMEILRNDGIDEILALCGGCCACATCHVQIDPAFVGLLPEMTVDENDLLDTTANRSPTSRLSCQLPMTDTLDGLRLTVTVEN